MAPKWDPTDAALLMALAQQRLALQAANLIHLARARPELEYVIRHGLIREAAYASLMRADRKVLHRAVGEALEQLHAERLEKQAATLAYYFERGEAPEQALPYFERAMRSASALFANDEAIAFGLGAIGQARRLAADDYAPLQGLKARLARLLEQLADFAELTGKLPQAEAAHEDALEHRALADRTDRVAAAEGNLAWLCLCEQRFGAARQHALKASALWQQSTFAFPFQWMAYLPRLAVALHDGDVAEAAECARVRLAPRQQRLPDPLDLPLTQAVACLERSDLRGAGLRLERAVAAAEQLHYL